jgi:FMN phosphatase YigB (HAD superfamily)
MIKLLAFDLFGTIFNLENVDRAELKEYGRQIKRNLTDWSPFDLPAHWAWSLPLHDDAIEGLWKLRDHDYRLVTFSNAPAKLQLEMINYHSLPFHSITPLESFRMSKPNPSIYYNLEVWGYDLSECAMITANKSFGDIEGMSACGGFPILIRDDKIPDLFALRDYLK